MPKRNHFISQLAHLEIYSPKLEESVKFFHDILGLEESGRLGNSVYMRAWGEFFHHSLKITEGPTHGLGHIGWRAESEEDLLEAVEFIESKGYGKGWIEGDLGHGRAYQFLSPEGHLEEIFWEVDLAVIPEDKQSKWRSRPQKNPSRGASVRRLDHVTLWSSDVSRHNQYYQELGFKYNEGVVLPDGKEVGSILAVSSLNHEVAMFADPTKKNGNLNHICYAVENRDQVLETADYVVDNGYRLEMKPFKHALGEAFTTYAIEPGGNRVEIYGGSPLYFAPDYGPKLWPVAENPNDAWSEYNIFMESSEFDNIHEKAGK
ncbi:VOC family protein [Alkalihalobacillus sp. MEB130]|uniref:VOC family protein n=1 Tax=Alkalihalobacillus sp. MEB130 TaxID=2976704 RepID=UPI0028E03DF1|nr:VOC family protein [Alkalihalobacillus sp. MEB130]MDT8860192.1 VOC family protein [Alkalihalobacillus sp. MEB130]